MMKNKGLRLIMGIFFVTGAGLSLADTDENSRRVEEKKRVIIDQAPLNEVVHRKEYSFESGGWLNYRISDYDELDNDRTEKDYFTRSLRADVRLWGRLTYRPSTASDPDKDYIYMRIKDIYTELQGTEPGARFDNRGPQVDYAYMGMDHNPWKVEAGRRYFIIGRGIAYSGVHDGVQVNYQPAGLNCTGFISQLPPHTSNIDTSVPGYDKESRRYFAGAGIALTKMKQHQIYTYTVLERDHSRERPENPFQDYRYDAEYFGLGSNGQWADQWPYWAEIIRETGYSREFPSNARSNISAWAFDAEQKFSTKWASKVVFSAEGALGSGDGDREVPTNTVYGNRSGRDHGFSYFGYLPTGAALYPALSNLRLLRLGVDAYPFYRIDLLRKILLGVDYYHYWKDRSDGGFSDLDATVARRDIGQEIDLKADWWVTKKVFLSAEWGSFLPGKAYDRSHRSETQVVSLSMSVIF
ncbi:MAG: alginate export family protein [Candidatus Omnitrophica bacterium]|nr:alginate export family protein [Candidatus Omnitrophota bacterium]